MKTVSIGDTHGIAIVKSVSEIIDEHDKFIFLGDYVDSSDVDNLTMKKNLLDLVELKKISPEKIVLLWGNHDIHYLLGNEHYCSGCRLEMKQDFYEIFHSNEGLFQLSYQVNDYLWTHAGVHAGWFENRFNPFVEKCKNVTSLSELLNIAFENRYPALFDTGYIRGGVYKAGGPLWCDITELESGPLMKYNQIVGHNRVKHFHIIKSHDKEIAFIDILGSVEIVNSSSFFYKEI